MTTIYQYRWGGFVISVKTAADWASRITGRTYTDGDYYAIEKAIEPKVRSFKAGFALVGDSLEDLAFMVITQSERLIGYKKGDPMPQFEEGEKEAMARPLLEGEGVTDYVFKTVRTGMRHQMDTVHHYRWGGFVISPGTAASWASRITGKALHGRELLAIQNAIRPKVIPFKAGFKLFGDSWEEWGFMVITRSERLIGYKKGDPVAQFEEGEKEAMAKPLLESEGVTDYVFKTVHVGIRVS